tara:strand:- start:260 stop:475 length:216 start_codon:yes stop_codon:yes gene_type:complete
MGRGVTQIDAVVGLVGAALRRRFAVVAAAASLSLRLQHDKPSQERNSPIKFIDKDSPAIKLVAGNNAVTDI